MYVLKLENESQKKLVLMKAMFSLADLPSHSLEYLGLKQGSISLFAKSSYHFSKFLNLWIL